MPYFVRMITAAGTMEKSSTPHATLEEAMNAAYAALRHGANDAWVDDHDGNKLADRGAIEKHCAHSKNSN